VWVQRRIRLCDTASAAAAEAVLPSSAHQVAFYRLRQLFCDVLTHEETTMKRLVRLLLLLLLVTMTYLNSSCAQLLGEDEAAEDVPGCPPSCVCFRTTVRCMFLQLDAVPDVPDSTTIL